MTLYTLVNEKGKVDPSVTFNPLDKSAVIPEVSSISVVVGKGKEKQFYLAFGSQEEAQHHADSLNGRVEGEHLFSPRLVSDDAERDYRAKLQSSELDSDYKEIEKAFKSAKRKKWLRRGAYALAGALLGWFDGEFVENKYHDVKAWHLANQGSAYVRVYDSEGLDSVVLTNNTVDNPNLTQIPPQRLHNFYADEFQATFPNLRSGHYVFNARVVDDDGNLESKTFELDIENPQGGIDSLYGSEATIDNERLPSGKERIRLGE